MTKLALALLAAASICAQSVKLDGLYLTMQRMGGGYSPSYYWFLPDGRVAATAPAGGLTPADFQSLCAEQPKYCGTFKHTPAGAAITMNGATRNLKVKPASGGFEFDELVTIKAEPMPAGAKLSGHYSGNGPRAAISTAGGSTINSAHTYTFKPDGTFNRRAIAAVRNSEVSATSSNSGEGKYRVSGNTIEFTENGKTTRHLIFIPYDGAYVIDGVICSLRK